MGRAHSPERQGQLGDLGLQGSDLLLEQVELVAQVDGIRPRGSGSRVLLSSTAPRDGHRLGSHRRAKRGQRTTVQLGELLKLGKGQTFETSIAGMRRAGKLGGFEPEPQGFGIDAQGEATGSQRHEGHEHGSFLQTRKNTTNSQDSREIPRTHREGSKTARTPRTPGRFLGKD